MSWLDFCLTFTYKTTTKGKLHQVTLKEELWCQRSKVTQEAGTPNFSTLLNKLNTVEILQITELMRWDDVKLAKDLTEKPSNTLMFTKLPPNSKQARKNLISTWWLSWIFSHSATNCTLCWLHGCPEPECIAHSQHFWLQCDCNLSAVTLRELVGGLQIIIV